MAPIESLFGEEADVLRDTDLELLLLANVVVPLGTALVSPLLDSLQGPYGASDAEIGLMMTLFTAPAIVMIPLIGVLTDRYGRKPFLVGGLVLFSLAGAALAATTDFRVALALRFCQGIGFAAVTPVIITCIGDLYSGNAEAAGQGFRFATSGLTQAIFPLVGGALVVVAWQYPLFIYAVGLPVAVVMAARFTDPVAGSGSREESVGTVSRRTYVRELFALALEPRIASVLIVRMVPIFIYMTFMTYISLLVVRVMGGTPGQAGALVALASVTYAVSATQAGRFGASFEGRVLPLAAAVASMGVGITVVAFAPSAFVAAAGVLAIGAGFGIALSLLRSVVTTFAPTQYRGGIVSVFESSGRVAATVAPIAVGILIGSAGGDATGVRSIQLAVAGVGIACAAAGLLSLLAAAIAPAVGAERDAVAVE